MSLKRTAGRESAAASGPSSRDLRRLADPAADGSVPPADTSPSRSESGSAAGLAAGESARADRPATCGRPTSTITRELDAKRRATSATATSRAHERAIAASTPPEADQALTLAAPAGGDRGRPRYSAGRHSRSPPDSDVEHPSRYGDEDQTRVDLPIARRKGREASYAANWTATCARDARSESCPGGGPERRGTIAEMVPIGQRQPEVDERSGAGSLEGRPARRQAKQFLRRHAESSVRPAT